MIVKLGAVPRVDLSAVAEDRLLEHVLSCGGGVVQFDRRELEALMVATVGVLADIDAALTLPPVIRDVVPRAN